MWGIIEDIQRTARHIRRKEQKLTPYDAETLVSQLANRHMRNDGITGACERNEFLATGEALFFDPVKQQVGAVIYEGNPVASYEEWHGRIQEWVELILSDPDQPYEPTQ